MTKRTYAQGVAEGRKLLADIQNAEKRIKTWWMDMAAIAVEVCDGDTYSVNKFSRDVGCDYSTLKENVRVYKNVYQKARITKKGKLAPSDLTRDQRALIKKVGRQVTSKASSYDVDMALKKEASKTKEDRQLEAHLQNLERLRDFVSCMNLNLLDKKMVKAVETHCDFISNKIKGTKTILRKVV